MFSYYGGKQNKAAWINKYIPSNIKNYGEPFGGAFWVYILGEFKTDNVFYNDFDPILYNSYKCLSKPREFLKFCEDKYGDIKVSDKEIVNKYRVELLEYIKNPVNSFDIGFKFIYVLSNIFSNQFTYGMIKNPINLYIKEKDKIKFKNKYFINSIIFKRLRNNVFIKRLENIKCNNKDYEDFIKEIYSDDLFLYIDPPYYGVDYYRKTKIDEINNYKRLCNLLKSLDCKFMLSYYIFDGLKEMFPEDKYIYIYKKFRVNGCPFAKNFNKRVVKREEVLILNYTPENMVLNI